MSTVILISAVSSRSHAIGCKGKLPWSIPEEMAHFKKTTTGNAVIFGRKTFEGIGKALPGRFNVVVTSSKSFNVPPAVSATCLEEAIRLATDEGYEQIFICGGESVYKSTLEKKLCHKILLSVIDEEAAGDLSSADAFFPEIPTDYIETKKTVKEKFTVLELTRKDCLR